MWYFFGFLAHLAKGNVSFCHHLASQNEHSLLRTLSFHRCFLPSFGSFGQAVSEEKILKNRPIRNKNRLWWPCLFHLAKGNVSFCHHLASVIRRLLTFHILTFSSETPQLNELKLGRKHLIE
jgi:hypothetical protein